MVQPLVSKDLWSAVEPLIPKRGPHPEGGGPPVDDRGALTSILFVLKSGILLELLTLEMGCSSGMTC
jgi:transposase